MTASANVLQMVRAHYSGDQSAFASAAMTLARGTKVFSIKQQIEMSVRDGMRRASAARGGYHPAPFSGSVQKPPPFQQLNPVSAGGLLQPLRVQTFEELLLPEHIQAEFDAIVTELEYRDELAERKLRARDRILLHGPPGNGKSSSASAIASALGVQAFGVSLPDLIDSFVGSTGKNLGKLFTELRPDTVCVFDELDAIGSSRGEASSSGSKELNSTVNTFLTLLDRSNVGIIIATTNRLDILDPALVRRFEEVIQIPAPSIAQMRALSERLCEGFGIAPVYVDDCSNFDAVTKSVKREARRVVMQEILAAEAAEEEGNDNGKQEE
jgi:SpoVK/Ycf46/Vps4 family AAA+-type ATPase